LAAASSSFTLHEARLCAVRLSCLALLAYAALAGVPGAALAGRDSAEFRFAPTNPTPGDTVVFTSTSTVAAGNKVNQLLWDLDDDGVFDDASGETASHSFPAPGSYRVRLLLVDKHPNHEHGASRTVTVLAEHQSPRNVPPNASFVSFPPAPVAGDTVSFFSTSTDPDSPIKGQEWDLDGDGQYKDAKGPTASRAYGAAGSYRVGLRVVDREGSSSVSRRTIAVSPRAAGFSVPAAGQLRLMTPFPMVRITGRVERRGTRLRRLTISAPTGARVKLGCRGRGCPFTRRSASARTAGTLRVRRLEGSLLRPRARIEVRVTRPDAIGKYTRFRFRKGKPPTRFDRCLVPGASRPVVCP
jgi:PKD repeat protein